jgi:hypothetical protein
MIKLEFHPTGEGYILCRRFRPDGSEASPLLYKESDEEPRLLSSNQLEEYKLAREMEFGQ